MSKYLVMRNSRRRETKTERNKTALGKLFIIVAQEYVHICATVRNTFVRGSNST